MLKGPQGLDLADVLQGVLRGSTWAVICRSSAMPRLARSRASPIAERCVHLIGAGLVQIGNIDA